MVLTFNANCSAFTDNITDFVGVDFHPGAHVDKTLLPLFGQGDEHPALVFGGFASAHDAVTLQPPQYAGHAWLEDAREVRQLVAFQFTLLAQDADHPPLLFGQVMFIEQRSEERHGRFAGLEQGERKGRSGGGHGSRAVEVEASKLRVGAPGAQPKACGKSLISK